MEIIIAVLILVAIYAVIITILVIGRKKEKKIPKKKRGEPLALPLLDYISNRGFVTRAELNHYFDNRDYQVMSQTISRLKKKGLIEKNSAHYFKTTVEGERYLLKKN